MGLLDALIPAAQAHEKWFVDPGAAHGSVPEFFVGLNVWTIGAMIAVVAVVVIGTLADRKFESSGLYDRLERRISPFREYAAGVLAVATGFALVWSASNGVLLADNFVIEADHLYGSLVRGGQGVIGLLLMIGLFTPGAALGLLALYGAAVGMFGVAEAIDYVHYVGIAVFLLAFSRGKYSLDWMLGKDFISTVRERRLSYLALRVISGTAFVILALGKWFRPDLHLALMAEYPDFNPYVILQSLWFPFTPEQYVFMLFVAELVIGIAVIGGYLTRIAAVALMPMMVVSVIFLGWGELVGHLPILGILVVLFIFGDKFHKEKGEEPSRSRRPTEMPSSETSA